MRCCSTRRKAGRDGFHALYKANLGAKIEDVGLPTHLAASIEGRNLLTTSISETIT